MDHYQDLLILPDSEFSAPILLNALFAKLHRSFVRIDNRTVGISFPRVDPEKPHLGNILRLHGRAMDLARLMEADWRSGMRDHLEINDVAPVPVGCKYCRVKRVQVKSNAERLRRRYAKRHLEATAEEINRLIPDALEKRVHLPYLRLKSTSTGQSFRLFLRHEEPQSDMVAGGFNAYGLSETATIPWF